MQTKRSSLIETLINVAIGFVVSMLLTSIVFPAYGHAINLNQNIQITAIFTVASIIRGYCIRRWFNSYIHRIANHVG